MRLLLAVAALLASAYTLQPPCAPRAHRLRLARPARMQEGPAPETEEAAEEPAASVFDSLPSMPKIPMPEMPKVPSFDKMTSGKIKQPEKNMLADLDFKAVAGYAAGMAAILLIGATGVLDF